jgi:hypothetical protein
VNWVTLTDKRGKKAFVFVQVHASLKLGKSFFCVLVDWPINRKLSGEALMSFEKMMKEGTVRMFCHDKERHEKENFHRRSKPRLTRKSCNLESPGA